MQRRDLLKMIAAATGLAMVGLDLYARDATSINSMVIQQNDQALLDEIAETIIPHSNTPGGKAAACGAAIAIFVNDCYTAEHQQLVHDGLLEIRALSKTRYGSDFIMLDTSQRHELLIALNRVAKNSDKLHYFTLLKQLVLFTFFTSKPGATEVLHYVAVPGRYDGAMPYKKGDRAWAT